jgi:translocation and assembly module TamB
MTNKVLYKSLKVLASLIVAVLVFLLIVVLYFNSKPGQKKLSNILFTQLSKQIGTPVSGKLSFSMPDWVKLDDLLIRDQKNDTLLFSQKAYLDVALFKLLNNQLVIEKVELENTVATIEKKDGVFNFDYIIDAFSSENPAPVDSTSVPLKITLANVNAKNLKAKYEDKDLEQLFNVKLGSLVSGFNTFDLEKAIYDLKDSKIADLTLSGKLGKPSTDTTASGPLPDIRIKELLAENLNWNLDLGNQITSGTNADLNVFLNRLDLPKMEVDLAKIGSSFSTLTFKDKTAKPSVSGEINFNDLALEQLKLAAENLVYKDTLIVAKLTTLSFKEKSGLELTKAETSATLNGNKLLLDNVDIATGASRIQSTIVVDLDTANYAKSRFDAKISDLKLAASEAFFFDKSLSKNTTFTNIRKDVFTGKGRITGTAEEINLQQVFLSAPSSTRLTVNGKIINKKTLGLDLTIKDLFTTHKDIQKFAGSLPENIQLPEQLTLNGSVKGTLEDLNTSIFLNSSQGGGRLALNLKNLSKVPQYSGTLDIENYAAGALIKNPTIGTVAGNIRFDGRGFENPSVKFNGDISEVNYSGSPYQNILLDGELHDNVITTTGSINDPKAKLSLDAVVDMSKEVITVTGKTTIERVNLKALGVLEENISIAGDFDINQLLVDLKKPFIDFKGKNITVYKDDEVFPIGDLTVLTEYGETEKRLDLTTRFMNLSLSGNFEYDRLQNILMGEVNKYFKLPDYQAQSDSLDFYFDINGSINYDPVFTAFVPSLKTFQPITIKSSLKSDGEIPFSGNIAIPFLQYDSIQVAGTTFEFTGDGNVLKYDLLTQQISNPSFRLRKAELDGQLRDNKASFALSVKDSLDKDIHSLAGLLESDGSKIRVSFDETGTMIFYEDWGGNPYGFIDYSSAGLYIENVVFSSKNQVLRVNSLSEEPNSPLAIFAENLDLNFLSRAILQDSTLMAGSLNLDLEVVNYMGNENLAFTGEVDIDDFHFNKIALGDLKAKAESNDLEKIMVFASLYGLENKFDLSGAYYTKREESLDFKLDIATLDFKVLEPFLEGIVYDLKGILTGDITVQGSTSKPEVNGEGEFTGMELRIKETAALIKIDKQKLKLTESKVHFEKFLIKDEADQQMLINGLIDFSNLPDFEYRLNLKADNFKIASSERGQSELFYGTAFLETNLNVRGGGQSFRLTGDIKTKEDTNLTLLLPDESYGEDLNAVVTFVDFRNPDKSKPVNTQTTFSLANAVNINVAIDEKTTVNMLMNPITGDMLTANGNGQLNVGFDNGGDLFIVGNLDIKRGSYDLTFQAIKKRFEITEVSKSSISFTGDPMKGILNVTAEYNVPGKKNILSYPWNENNPVPEKYSSGKLLVDVRMDLVLTGEIMNMNEPIFQIVVNEKQINDESLKTTLTNENIIVTDEKGGKEDFGTPSAVATTQSKSNEDKIRQNAIMLLLTGNFSATQFFDSFGASGGGGYEDLARRNASQIISSQLEKYASGLIKGIDLDLGLQSSGGTAGSDGSDRSTNVNVGVSKRLANDRLVVSVGKNFELENKARQSDEVFDNVEANWMITPEGRYRLKVFRKTQNFSAIDGQVIETGLGFIIAIDYDTWRELMKRKK